MNNSYISMLFFMFILGIIGGFVFMSLSNCG